MYTDADGIQELVLTRRYRLADDILNNGSFQSIQLEAGNTPTSYVPHETVEADNRPTQEAPEEPAMENVHTETPETVYVPRLNRGRLAVAQPSIELRNAVMRINGEDFPFGTLENVRTRVEPYEGAWMPPRDAPLAFATDYLSQFLDTTPVDDGVRPGTITAGQINADQIFTSGSYVDSQYVFPWFSSPKDKYRNGLIDFVNKEIREEKSVSFLNLLLLEKANEEKVLALFKHNSGKVSFS